MKKIWRKVLVAIWAAVILLNAAAWNSSGFCDWYLRHIFPFWVNTYGRLTGLFPFSVGEIMIGIGLLLVFLAAALGVARLFGGLISLPARAAARRADGKSGWERFCRGSGAYFKIFFSILTGVGAVMTLNCFILYHASTFNEKYFGAMDREYSLEELITLRNFVVERCNVLSGQISREADGGVRYEGDMAQAAGEAMRRLGETYGGLSGFYPEPKPLLCSDFMSQQHMAGYYFPFSMEANYNGVMYPMNRPAVFCHELAHLKGYIYEDEANFIGYLACIGSDDVFFRYSGYLSVLYYLDNDFYEAVGGDRDRYLEQPFILPQVHNDNIFLTQEEWERIEGKAFLDTEMVEAVSDSLTDASLKLNGVSDGKTSYSRVVKLLLQYYDKNGYEEDGPGRPAAR